MARTHSFRPIFLTAVIAATIIAIGLAIGLGVGLNGNCDDAEKKDGAAEKKDGAPSKEYKSAHGSYQYAAVTSDDKICSDIGIDIMARHRGNAIDAAIATLLCIGAMCSHSGGVGGGSFAMVFDKKTNSWHAVDFRESAPSGATETMFSKEEDRKKSVTGGLAIGVPGELLGAVEMHEKFGTVPWKTLVTPTIKLLRDGFPLHNATWKAVAYLNSVKTGFEMFMDEDNNRMPLDSIIKMPKLARTFEKIAEDPSSFYNGSLAEDIVKDVQEAGGIITLNDLKDYKVKTKEPIKLDLPGNMTLYSMPPPGSGAVLAYILSILSGYNMTANSIASDQKTVLTYHRIVEAMKFAYARRSELGDEDFVDVKALVEKLTSRSYGEETRMLINDTHTQDIPFYKPSYFNVEDAGTAHLDVLDGEGNAVSITTTVNHYFGSKVVGSRTGIIFNNEMDDFSTPGVVNYFGVSPSPANFIKPGKRPMSSMSPTIVWDHNKGRVSMVTGGAGGTRITTATALAMIDILWFNMSVVQATDLPRFHHQLIPDSIRVEPQFPKKIQQGLEAKGHKFGALGRSVVQTIARLGSKIQAVADGRKGGEPRGF